MTGLWIPAFTGVTGFGFQPMLGKAGVVSEALPRPAARLVTDDDTG